MIGLTRPKSTSEPTDDLNFIDRPKLAFGSSHGLNSFLKTRLIASSSARKGYFFQVQVYERVQISFVKVYEGVGKLIVSFWSVKEPKRANIDEFKGFERREPSGLVIYSY